MPSQPLVIQSLFRESPATTTPSSFRIRTQRPHSKVKSVELLSLILPPIYNVAAWRENTIIQFYTASDNTNYTATVAEGAYSAVVYRTALQAALNAAGSPATFSVSLNITTLKYSVMVTGSAVELGEHNSAGTGFVTRDNKHSKRLIGAPFTGALSIAAAATEALPNAVDFTYSNPLYLSIGQFGESLLTSYNQGSVNADWAITKYNTDTGGVGNVVTREAFYHMGSCVPQGIDDGSLSVVLRDEYGRIVDTNGSEWSFILRLNF